MTSRDVGEWASERAVRALAEVTDEQLEELYRAAWDLMDRFGFRGFDEEIPPAAVVCDLLVYVVSNERIRRAELLHNARTAIEANGHEAWIDYDQQKEDQTGAGWWAYCSCHGPALGPPAETYDEAVSRAGEHAAEHGGRWGAPRRARRRLGRRRGPAAVVVKLSEQTSRTGTARRQPRPGPSAAQVHYPTTRHPM
jgi:hypothetical protein